MPSPVNLPQPEAVWTVGRWPFPTLEAAERFALNNHQDHGPLEVLAPNGELLAVYAIETPNRRGKYRTGFCSADTNHARCPYMVRNGVNAEKPILFCSCECHRDSAKKGSVPISREEGRRLMAQKVQVTVTSDLSGNEGADTLTFGLDGQTYEIDLTDDEAASFREALAPYVGAARRAAVTVSRGRAPRAVPTGPDPKAVRAWAASKGITVPERGRLPKDVVGKFEADQAKAAKKEAKNA